MRDLEVMASFTSRKDYWEFARHVKTTSRYLRDEHSTRFLEAVLETSATRHLAAPAGTGLWRAQLGPVPGMESITDEHGIEIDAIERPEPYSACRMKPQGDRAQEGRVNAKGIPCLYLANNRDTAMLETRPWVGSYVSVAKFVTSRDLLLVDCAKDKKSPGLWLERDGQFRTSGTPQQLEKAIWWHINQAFSEPVTRSDDLAEYAPTQILAEYFKSHHFDGILYGSKLGRGINVAIFDTSAAEVASCALYEVRGVSMDFQDSHAPYCVDEYAKMLRFDLTDEPDENP